MATYYVRTDGSDLNTGTGPATNQAWKTVGKALGATGIGVGDTLYIAPGVYRESVTAAFANPASEGQRITISGDPTASQFTGVSAGPVIITNYVNLYSTTGSATLGIAKSYITLQNVHITGYTTGGSGNYGSIFGISGTSNIVTSCGFYTPVNSIDINAAVIFGLIQGTTGFTVTKCVFMAPVRIGDGSTTTSAWNSLSSFKDCIFQNPGQYTPTACLILYSPYGAHIGGVTVQNCRFIGNTGIAPYPANNFSSSFPITVRNCIFETSYGINVNNADGQMVESHNIFNCGFARGNVATGTGSSTRAFISPDYNLSRVTGWGNYPFWANHSSSASQNAGTSTGAPATDIYGVTWLAPSTPTMGAIEYFDSSSTGRYVPTERNASTITIAPGSTSQSIELYLGAIGLTASTSGLSAYYNRTRSADVQINLQARNITQNWTSGGFAEVNPNTMPGVYRLDIPNEALAAGADDVTVVVRGASGTNGAVMSIKLSSGGLTTAQTASAVWNALTNDHTTHGTFGWNVLRADQDSKEGLVTLHQSGGVSRVDADIHAVANDTAAATALKGALLHDGTGYVDSDVVRVSTSVAAANELEGALLHNGTDYIDSNLIGGAATRVFVGRFQMTQTGTTQGDIIEAFTTDTPAFELQLFDGDNNLVPVTGATLGLRILDVTSTVVETGTPTIEYGTGGIVRWTAPGTYLSIGCPAGMYRLFVDRTVSGTTTTFGPLQIKVQVQ